MSTAINHTKTAINHTKGGKQSARLNTTALTELLRATGYG